MGKLRIIDDGIRFESEAEFLKTLYTSKIKSKEVSQVVCVQSRFSLSLILYVILLHKKSLKHTKLLGRGVLLHLVSGIYIPWKPEND